MSLKNLSLAVAKFNDTPLTPDLLHSDESEIEASVEKKKKKKGSRKEKHHLIDPMAKEGEKPRKHRRRRTATAKPLVVGAGIDPSFRTTQSEIVLSSTPKETAGR